MKYYLSLTMYRLSLTICRKIEKWEKVKSLSLKNEYVHVYMHVYYINIFSHLSLTMYHLSLTILSPVTHYTLLYPNPVGLTPLHIACARNDEELSVGCIEKGGDLKGKVNGRNPIEMIDNSWTLRSLSLSLTLSLSLSLSYRAFKITHTHTSISLSLNWFLILYSSSAFSQKTSGIWELRRTYHKTAVSLVQRAFR